MKTYCEQCDEDVESVEQVMNKGTDQELTIHICPKCEEPIPVDGSDYFYDDDEDLEDWEDEDDFEDDDFEGDDEPLNEDDLDI